MPSVKGAESRRCPAVFQERITRSFGVNLYGEPNFKIVWGQSQFLKTGNSWRDLSGEERIGYRERYQCHGMPCWVIMRWHAPIEYGSPRSFYSSTWMPAASQIDPRTGEESETPRGFYAAGEYPWRGRYEIVQPLISKEMIDGRLVVTHFPLTHYLIDTLMPMMEAFNRLSAEKKAAAQAAAKAAEEKEQADHIEKILVENMPTYWGPVSYGAQGIRTSLLDRKMEQIQKVWDRMSHRGRRPKFSRGMALGDKPMMTH